MASILSRSAGDPINEYPINELPKTFGPIETIKLEA
jgi:hypothetical protein